ncbi:hypothetical protein DY000_02029683 [Brassica cretica]|uniref:Uncharacterized protein n=1 Tax=Brassica cretica TaxID=69181 RepID=A0ABQ7DV10_BRACR|nr:hypothetical protein DY000_02029683 [Brassica cretica]
MKLRPSPRPEDRSDQTSTRPYQLSRQARVNSRARLDLDHARLDVDHARLDVDHARLDEDHARFDLDYAILDLDREVSQNDQDFSLLVRLARTDCSNDRANGLTLMSNSLLDFYHSNFSKTRIIQLSEDLSRINTLLDQATDCPDRPAFVQLLTANSLVSCRVILQVNISSLVGLDVTFQITIEAGSIIRLDVDHARLDEDHARFDLDYAILDLDREVSQNDQDFSLLVRLARTDCSNDRANGLTLMSNSLLDFYHSNFSKTRIIQLSEDLSRINTLLDQATDCPDRPAFVQLLTAVTST